MSLAAFLTAHRHDGIVLVRIEGTTGSTPREAGASMAVTAYAIAGTIGGGQLEFHCIDLARHMLSEGAPDQILDIPLGPQMGQCCIAGGSSAQHESKSLLPLRLESPHRPLHGLLRRKLLPSRGKPDRRSG